MKEFDNGFIFGLLCGLFVGIVAGYFFVIISMSEPIEGYDKNRQNQSSDHR